MRTGAREHGSTFVIDGAGKLARGRRGLKVTGHAQEVLDFVKTL